mmetsp:Transcript_137204/g.438765  ORF Transcript_137204/g.438765 Transcript_137204/m.438765 type:complete len:305 (+) Transcript_137204:639-1553(+)
MKLGGRLRSKRKDFMGESPRRSLGRKVLFQRNPSQSWSSTLPFSWCLRPCPTIATVMPSSRRTSPRTIGGSSDVCALCCHLSMLGLQGVQRKRGHCWRRYQKIARWPYSNATSGCSSLAATVAATDGVFCYWTACLRSMNPCYAGLWPWGGLAMRERRMRGTVAYCKSWLSGPISWTDGLYCGVVVPRLFVLTVLTWNGMTLRVMLVGLLIASLARLRFSSTTCACGSMLHSATRRRYGCTTTLTWTWLVASLAQFWTPAAMSRTFSEVTPHVAAAFSRGIGQFRSSRRTYDKVPVVARIPMQS